MAFVLPPAIISAIISGNANLGGLFGAIIICLIFGLITRALAKRKNKRKDKWFALGFFFLLIPIIVIFCLPKEVVPGASKRCTQCLDVVNIDAVTCPKCGAMFNKN